MFSVYVQTPIMQHARRWYENFSSSKNVLKMRNKNIMKNRIYWKQNKKEQRTEYENVPKKAKNNQKRSTIKKMISLKVGNVNKMSLNTTKSNQSFTVQRHKKVRRFMSSGKYTSIRNINRLRRLLSKISEVTCIQPYYTIMRPFLRSNHFISHSKRLLGAKSDGIWTTSIYTP